jgi:hypothetical protein
MKKSFSDDKLIDRATPPRKQVKFAAGNIDSDDDELENRVPSSRVPLLSKSVLSKLNSHLFTKFKTKNVSGHK